MDAARSFMLDINYGNIEPIFVDRANLLVKERPVAFGMFEQHHLKAGTRRGKKVYSSSKHNFIFNRIYNVLHNYFKNSDNLDYTTVEVKSCTHTGWVFVMCPPTTIVLQKEDIYANLPVPIPETEDVLFPLDGVWFKGDLVIFYKNLINEKLYVAVFGIEELDGEVRLLCKYKEEFNINIDMKYRNLIPTRAYYMEIKHEKLEGLFFLKFPYYDKLIVMSSNFKFQTEIYADSMVATERAVVFMQRHQLFCCTVPWFVSSLHNEDVLGRIRTLRFMPYNEYVNENHIKSTALPESSEYNFQLAVLSKDIYALKVERAFKCNLKLKNSFRIVVNKKGKKLIVYKQHLTHEAENIGLKYFSVCKVIANNAQVDLDHMNFKNRNYSRLIKMDTVVYG